MAKCCLKVGRKSKSEARNLSSSGCKSMTDGPTIMLGVFITLLYAYTMPISHYSIKPTSLRCHLMAKHCLKVGRNRNLRQEICQHMAVKVYMVEGLTIMLGVFINLLCTYTMPNKHYYSKPTSLRCHLMAKHCLKVGRKIRIFFCWCFLMKCIPQAKFLFGNGLMASSRP